VLFDSLFADFQAPRHLPLRQTFHTPQDQRFAADLWQLLQSRRNGTNLLLKFQPLLAICVRFGNLKQLQIAAGGNGYHPRMANVIYDDAPRRQKRVLLGKPHGFQGIQREKLGIHFLDHIFQIQIVEAHVPESCPDKCFVGKHIARKPSASFTKVL
jgi:hypothetical protein